MFTRIEYKRDLLNAHLIGALLSLIFAGTALATAADDLRQQTQIAVKNIVEPQLQRFCPDACQLTRTEIEVREDVSEFTELGFEAIVGNAAQPRLLVQSATANIQIDANITADNRERLRTILMNQLRSVALNTEVVWQPVEIPQIGQTRGTSYAMERQLERDIEQAVRKTIDAYCPDRCLLAMVAAEGAMINADQAEALPRNEVVRDASGRSFMQIKQVTVELALDESLDAASRDRIANMVRANTRFASPVNLKVSVSQFPQSYADKLKNEGDPYGLDKLRQMLIMFRELAGTKEIITNSSNTNSSDSKTSAVNSSNSTESNKSTESQMSKSALIDSKQSYAQGQEQDWVMWGAIALAVIVAAFLAIRLSSANRDAKIMVSTAGPGPAADGHGHHAQQPGDPVRYDEQGRPQYSTTSPAATNQSVAPQDVSQRLKIENLKDTLVRQFMAEPRVAKETFGRMLKEDGVELTARYLQIFGHMIVLELIEDPKLSRDLYALSEFFNKSHIELSAEDELRLLQTLRTKQTASEIKVMTSKGSDKFEFLDRLDPAQIFTLISEEKPQVQSIVLTQLEKKIRMSVFDMYQGGMKVRLMNELCKADAIPKEYLANVAKALHRKVDSRPEFDTENIRSSEIIIDLLERSSLEEQRQIMAHLQRTNADTARGILMKLVTLEILPYLKDGHLLEIILGMDREDLLTFLAGTQDHIRQLLMSKAPYELTEGWLEELNNMGIIDENNYKLVELKVFNKIRNLSNSGVVNILDINEMIYSPDHQVSEEQVGGISSNAMVA